jgi:RNA polymerase sigma-70 factor (ECF subfamily)
MNGSRHHISTDLVRALGQTVEHPGEAGRAAIAGERDAVWATLYERHFDDVYRLVRRGGVATTDADDVTQRVFLRVHDLLEHTPVVVHPHAWLRAITIRVVSEHHRFWRLRRVKSWMVELAAGSRPAADSPEECARASEEQERVAEILARMSPKLRDVLVLCDLEDLDAAEVAPILGIPKNTVRSRRLLARDQFARLWSRRHGRRE